jgi:uncharacterized SAM-binding protein YcdF (DUF218 family)
MRRVKSGDAPAILSLPLRVSYIDFVFPLFLFLAIAGLIRIWRSRERKRPSLAATGIVGLFLVSYYPLAWLFTLPLESSYETNPIPRESAQALVVLSGGAYPPVPDRPYTSPQRQTYERSRHTAWLYKNWKALPVLACGGGPYGEPLSFAMREVLEAEGVPADKIWLETRSSSTYENAVYGCEILRRHGISRIILVEEPRFLPRAVACFRKQGMRVVPAAFNFTHLYWEPDDFLPSSRAIQLNGELLHEYVGLLWYRMRGRI